MQMELERLNQARAKVQSLTSEGHRIEGELASARKRNDELEQQCRDKFDAPTAKLPDIITEFKGIVTAELHQAEVVLGIAGGIEEEPEDTDGLPI